MLKCPKCLSDHVRHHSHTASGKQRYSCGEKGCGHRTVNPLGLHEVDHAVDRKVSKANSKKVTKNKSFLITSAQNATPVPDQILNTLKTVCNHDNRELIVVPYRYKNPTSIFTDKDHDWWDDKITEYLMDVRTDVCEGLTILGDIKVQPTAVDPLTGLEGFTGTNSCIVAHPKKRMKTVPTRKGDMAKIMQTTGTVTLENYTSSKAGAKGKHHHTFGGLIVDVDASGNFHIRRITVNKDGSCYDLDRYFDHKGNVTINNQVDALVLGDLHFWWMDTVADEAIRKKLIPKLNPKNIILHDVIDSYSISHHHRNKPFTKYSKHHNSLNNIKTEIQDFIEWVRNPEMKQSEVYIVPSNHHEHIFRWIEESDWKDDPENAEFYLETALHMLRNTEVTREGTETPDPFHWWINRFDPDLRVVGEDESLVFGPYECGMHGHKGPNGSRGSLKNLARIGVPVIHGHCHSPEEIGDSLAVGVNTGDMEYAQGPSGWLQSNAVIYPDGNATLIHTIKGNFER